LIGQGGNDIYVVISPNDTVIEQAVNGGIDRIESFAANQKIVLPDFVENMHLRRLDFLDGDGTGNGLDNEIEGSKGVNTLLGLGGDDLLDGNLGIDTLVGGTGDDTYVVDESNEIVIEAPDEGTDLVRASANFVLPDNVENLILEGTAGFGQGNGLANTIDGNASDNLLRGEDGDDILRGFAGTDALDGGAGADQMFGGAGSDVYSVDDAGDVIDETGGDGAADTANVTFSGGFATFVMAAGLENATVLGGTGAITGNAGANIVQTIGVTVLQFDGGGGADALNGGADSDVLIGGDGGDTLTGGADADRFDFAGNAGLDTIAFVTATTGLANFGDVRP